MNKKFLVKRSSLEWHRPHMFVVEAKDEKSALLRVFDYMNFKFAKEIEAYKVPRYSMKDKAGFEAYELNEDFMEF